MRPPENPREPQRARVVDCLGAAAISRLACRVAAGQSSSTLTQSDLYKELRVFSPGVPKSPPTERPKMRCAFGLAQKMNKVRLQVHELPVGVKPKKETHGRRFSRRVTSLRRMFILRQASGTSPGLGHSIFFAPRAGNAEKESTRERSLCCFLPGLGTCGPQVPLVDPRLNPRVPLLGQFPPWFNRAP